MEITWWRYKTKQPCFYTLLPEKHSRKNGEPAADKFGTGIRHSPFAIRMAKASKGNINNNNKNGAGPSHSTHNQDRPDKPFKSDRAKKEGNANVCNGRIFVTVSLYHFGPITPEHDPERNQVRMEERGKQAQAPPSLPPSLNFIILYTIYWHIY